MENTEDSEATPLLREQSGRGRSNQLICLMICAVGCIVTTGMVLCFTPRSVQGGEGGTLEGGGAVSQGWHSGILLFSAKIVLGVIGFFFLFFCVGIFCDG